MSDAQPAGAGHLVSQLARMLEVARSNLDGDFEVTRRLVTEASVLLESHLTSASSVPAPSQQRAGLARWQMTRVREFIDSHLTENIRVADLSALARSSTSYFSAAFKRSFGASPHAYVMRRRISMAAQLMLNSCQPLSQIAIHCGFADQAHFSRQFRRLMGNTPSTWRREQASQPFG